MLPASSAESLSAILDPRSIAVIGASENPSRIGGRVVHYLKRWYQGELLPVNPNRETVQGLRAVSSVSAFDPAPDLAIVAIPAPDVVATVRDCAEAGVRAALIFTSGFAEAGAEGAQWQKDLADLAARGIRICGPNCLGLINVHSGVVATFVDSADARLEPGGLAAGEPERRLRDSPLQDGAADRTTGRLLLQHRQ